MFSSKISQLTGNHFLAITEGLDLLAELGRKVLWEGSKDIGFALA
jgi:hypothetical protein